MPEQIQCSCFSVNPEAIPSLERSLRSKEFTEPPQICEANQSFGMAKPIDGVWQLHVRGFSNGRLKGEIELRWIYVEHSTHPSYSAHKLIQQLLDEADVSYVMQNPPPHCVEPRPIQPESLTEWRDIEGEALARSVVGAVAGEKISLKEMKETLQKLRSSLNQFSTTAMKFIDLEAGKQNLRVRVDCPIFKVCQEWCEKSCLPMINTFLDHITEKITFTREAPTKHPSGRCQFDFFLADPM